MIVVSDTTTISNLIHIGQLQLLRALYTQIAVPHEVYNELSKLPTQKQVIDSLHWILVKSINDIKLFQQLSYQLDSGEAEAITLALELKSPLLIIDELKGRAIAKSYGLRIIGLIGILIEAKQNRLLSSVKPLMEKLIYDHGFRIHPNLYRQVLDQVNE